VIQKPKASAFFGTLLNTVLRHKQVSTLVITGATTSGCVRASVVDGFSYGFKVIVVEDGVFDRTKISHLVNLFDMDAKYTEVVTINEILAKITDLN